MTTLIDIEQLLIFYDETPDQVNRGPVVSAITGLIGEDLMLGLLKHYFENHKKRCEIIYNKPIGDGNRSQLDAWIFIQRENLYQVEIKNWSAWSIPRVSVDNENPSEAGDINRKNYLYTRNTKAAEKVWKVLRPMQSPTCKEGFKPKPLLAFWCPISPATIEEPFSKFSITEDVFSESIDSTGFPNDFEKISQEVSIFSASFYLRQLRKKIDRIKIEMPRAKDRIDYIHRLFPEVLSKASLSK